MAKGKFTKLFRQIAEKVVIETHNQKPGWDKKNKRKLIDLHIFIVQTNVISLCSSFLLVNEIKQGIVSIPLDRVNKIDRKQTSSRENLKMGLMDLACFWFRFFSH